MKQRIYRISRESKVTLSELQAHVADVWAEMQVPGSAAHESASAWLPSPEAALPAAVDTELALAPAEQYCDPAIGALIVVIWLGEKVAEKALDALWDHVILPRIGARWGRGAVVEQAAPPDSGAADERGGGTA